MQKLLFAPTEAGYSVADLKRAALVFDEINLLDANDRELFPTNALPLAVGMPPIASMGGRTVRPMGKTPDYDAQFDDLVAHCAPLIEEGAISVTRTYDRAASEGVMTIGVVPLGGFPVDIPWLLEAYRHTAGDERALGSVIEHSAVELARSRDPRWNEFGYADGKINDSNPLGPYGGPVQDESMRTPLTFIARSRIGMALKVAGCAERRGLIPALPTSSADLIDQMTSHIRAAVDAQDPDPYWLRRLMILDVVMRTEFDDERLEAISIQDILEFRTGEMRRAGEARIRLLSDLREMAGQATNLDLGGFRERVTSRLDEFNHAVRALNEQRQRLNIKVGAHLVGVAAGSGGTVTTGAAATSVVGQVALPISITAGLSILAVGAANLIKEFHGDFSELFESEKNFAATPDFAVFRSLGNIGGDLTR